MNPVEIPADAITFKEYAKKVASTEFAAVIDAITKLAELRRGMSDRLRGAASVTQSGQGFGTENYFRGVTLPAVRAITCAQQTLRDKVCGPLREGSVVAYGEPSGGFPIAEIIPAELWEHLAFERTDSRSFPYHGPNDVWFPSKPEVGFCNVRVIEAPLSPVERCRNWLRARVAEGGPAKPKFYRRSGVDTAATSYWGEAQSKFGITKGGFEAIWTEVTRGRDDWTRPGRRPVHK